MRSVADELREQDRQAVLRLSPAERIALAFHLGERDLAIFCATQGLDRAEGFRQLRQRRQWGRTPSACMNLGPD